MFEALKADEGKTSSLIFVTPRSPCARLGGEAMMLYYTYWFGIYPEE